MIIVTKVDGWLHRFKLDEDLVRNEVLFFEFTSGDGQAGHVSVRNYSGEELECESLGFPPDPPPWYARGVAHMPTLQEQKQIVVSDGGVGGAGIPD